MNKQFIKITFLGDITCDRPLLAASKNTAGEYDFSGVFSEVGPFLSASDYVVANFETVCAGSNDDYSNEFFLYNTPDDIIPAIKNAGIDFVTTANNHCLDQGVNGLKRTIRLLDKYNVGHTGTFASPEERKIEKQVISIGGVKVAILAYTSDTNESNTGIVLNENDDYLVGLLRKQADSAKQAKGIKGLLARCLSKKQKRLIQRIVSRTKLRLGMSYFKPFTDHLTESDTTDNPYLIKVKEEIEDAKKIADIVIVCPHMGGQFNTEPGSYSAFVIDYLRRCGADVIVGNHPHVIQKTLTGDSWVAAFSVGGFNLSLSADYIVHESLPAYSMAFHVYVNRETRKIGHASFSVLKNVEDSNHLITVYPIGQLPPELITEQTRSEITTIYNRITGSKAVNLDIQEEYPL